MTDEQLISSIYKATADSRLWPEIGNRIFSRLNNHKDSLHITVVPPLTSASQLIDALAKRAIETSSRVTDEEETGFLDRVTSHLYRARDITAKLSSAQQLTGITMDLMNQLTLACGLISTDGRLLQHNELFGGLLKNGVVILKPDQKLKLSTAEAELKIQEAINNNKNKTAGSHQAANDIYLPAATINSNSTGETSTETRFAKRTYCTKSDDLTCFRYKTGGGHNLIVHFIPREETLQLSQNFFSEKFAGLLFLQNLNDLQLPKEIVLKNLWNFTTGEVKVLHHMLQGYSTVDSAQALNCTTNAVRFHFKSMFRKTNTKKQSELMGLTMSALGRFDWSKNSFDRSNTEVEKKEMA